MIRTGDELRLLAAGLDEVSDTSAVAYSDDGKLAVTAASDDPVAALGTGRRSGDPWSPFKGAGPLHPARTRHCWRGAAD